MENKNEINSMNDVMKQIDSSMNNIRTGKIVHGKVISVTDEELIVNIGYSADGIVKKQDINSDINFNICNNFKVNDEIDLYVVKIEDEDGNVLLSKIKADEIIQWNKLSNILKNDEIIQVKIEKVVKGGVVAYFDNISAFIPASQLSVKFVKNFNEFIGKIVKVKIIELDRSKKRVILSRKEVEQIEIEKKKEIILDSIKVGEKVRGKIDKLTKFGAFVDLGGIDGLIHISELSWGRVKNPEDVVSLGDEVEVYVLNVDKERSRISLSLKDVYGNPWNNVNNNYKIGDILKGKVVNIINVGAFVELEPGIEGFVHISEISDEHIAKVEDAVKVGDRVSVKILNIDLDANKISLSIKNAVEEPMENYNKYIDNSEGFSMREIFKDKLGKK